MNKDINICINAICVFMAPNAPFTNSCGVNNFDMSTVVDITKPAMRVLNSSNALPIGTSKNDKD